MDAHFRLLRTTMKDTFVADLVSTAIRTATIDTTAAAMDVFRTREIASQDGEKTTRPFTFSQSTNEPA